MNTEFFMLSPVIFLTVVALIGITLDAIKENNTGLGFSVAMIGLIGTAVLSALTMTVPEGDIANLYNTDLLTAGTFAFGGLGSYFDILFCVAAILTLLASRNYLAMEQKETTEYYNLILFAVAGMMIISHSKHLLTLFIGIETMSVTFYILAGYFRHTDKSVEASLKYFLLGAFSTGFLLNCMAMIYGSTGTMMLRGSGDVANIASAISAGEITNYFFLAMGVGMMIVGLAFKVAAFPFHQWAPDVYTGAPTVVSGFMSTAGKSAALLSFIIFSTTFLPLENVVAEVQANTESALTIVAILSALTMLVGNVTALVQKNVKRMLAFSSVAHAGYLLMGIVANSEAGYHGIIFYMTAYTFMQLGAFAVVSLLERDGDRYQMIDDYAGLYKSNPLLALIMAIFMFSLAGIPPMAGFFGKYYLFSAAIESGYTWLTIVAVVSSIISMYFYIGLVLSMYFKEKEGEQLVSIGGGGKVVALISVTAILVLGIMPSLLTTLIDSIKML
ncbi:MAG: NADH-quinone oxidoreductase subunit N [Candidatus Kapaibacteriales bacterium]